MTAPKRGTGLRPAFTRLWAAYLPNYRVERPALYTELGIQTLNDDPSFTNTCAIRVSYALAKVGLPVTKGGLKIQAGPHKGKRLEPGMRNLANYLARSDRRANRKSLLVKMRRAEVSAGAPGSSHFSSR